MNYKKLKLIYVEFSALRTLCDGYGYGAVLSGSGM